MRQTDRLSAFLLVSIASVFLGCGKGTSSKTASPAAKPSDPPPDHIVAKVNGTPLTWAELDKRAMGYLKDDVEVNHLVIPSNRLDEAKEHFRRRSINAFVFKTVMMDEAVKQNIRLSEADRQESLNALAQSLRTRNWTTNDFFQKGPMGVEMMRREFEDGMIIDKLLIVNVRNKIRVGEKEVADAIATLNATNQLNRAKLEAVRKQLLAGADFADMARTVSECPSAKKEGDLGEFPRGKMLKEFDDAAFSQAVGEIGPIIETRFGFHIIKVTAHTAAQAATGSTPAVPETVRASHILLKHIPINRKRINDSILRTKYNAGVERFFAELKAKAQIECYLYKDMTFK